MTAFANCSRRVPDADVVIDGFPANTGFTISPPLLPFFAALSPSAGMWYSPFELSCTGLFVFLPFFRRLGHSRLAEIRHQSVKISLRPFVEGMIVALRARHARAHERLRHRVHGFDAVLLIADEKIYRPIIARRAAGRQ